MAEFTDRLLSIIECVLARDEEVDVLQAEVDELVMIRDSIGAENVLLEATTKRYEDVFEFVQSSTKYLQIKFAEEGVVELFSTDDSDQAVAFAEGRGKGERVLGYIYNDRFSGSVKPDNDFMDTSAE